MYAYSCLPVCVFELVMCPPMQCPKLHGSGPSETASRLSTPTRTNTLPLPSHANAAPNINPGTSTTSTSLYYHRKHQRRQRHVAMAWASAVRTAAGLRCRAGRPAVHSARPPASSIAAALRHCHRRCCQKTSKPGAHTSTLVSVVSYVCHAPATCQCPLSPGTALYNCRVVSDDLLNEPELLSYPCDPPFFLCPPCASPPSSPLSRLLSSLSPAPLHLVTH